MKKAVALLLSFILAASITGFASAADTVQLKSIGVDMTCLSLQIGKTGTLKATLIPSNTTQKGITFTSSNPKIATVSSSGVITAVSEGQVMVNVTSTADKTIFAQCDVIVWSYADPLGKYPNTLTLTSVRFTTSSYQFPTGDDINNNQNTRYDEGLTNIHVKYDWTVDQSQYQTKLNASIAAGKMPDFFQCDPATFTNLCKNGMITDLTAVYNTYASPRLKATGVGFPDGFNSGKYNGKQMGLPLMNFGTIDIPQILWIRSDWLSQSGMQAPVTISQLETLANTFMQQHPGSYGLAVDNTLYDAINGLTGLFNGFGSYPGLWVKDPTGKLVYGSIQPATKTALTEMQSMYKKGIISQEFGIKDVNKVNEDITNGKVGIMYGVQWACYYPFPTAVQNDPNAVWKPYPVPSTDGKMATLAGGWPVYGYWVVSKNCKSPEAIVKMLNAFFVRQDDRAFSLDHMDDKVQVDWQTGPISYDDPMQDYNGFVNISAALVKKDSAGLNTSDFGKYTLAMKWVTNKDNNGYGYYYQVGPEGSLSVIRPYVDQNKILLDGMKGAMPSGYAQKYSSLNKLELDTFTKIIMGTSVDSFDQFVKSWGSMGGTAATTEMNNTYNK